jgi:hypothetical protein
MTASVVTPAAAIATTESAAAVTVLVERIAKESAPKAVPARATAW